MCTVLFCVQLMSCEPGHVHRNRQCERGSDLAFYFHASKPYSIFLGSCSCFLSCCKYAQSHVSTPKLIFLSS